MDKVNVGLVGLSWPGQRHAEGVQGSDLGELYAACDLDEVRRQAFAANYAPNRLFADYDQMLADPALQAVIISLPNLLSFPAALKTPHCGKHCLWQKPTAADGEPEGQLRNEADSRGLI